MQYLPLEMIDKILSYLTAPQLYVIAQTCRPLSIVSLKLIEKRSHPWIKFAITHKEEYEEFLKTSIDILRRRKETIGKNKRTIKNSLTRLSSSFLFTILINLDATYEKLDTIKVKYIGDFSDTKSVDIFDFSMLSTETLVRLLNSNNKLIYDLRQNFLKSPLVLEEELFDNLLPIVKRTDKEFLVEAANMLASFDERNLEWISNPFSALKKFFLRKEVVEALTLNELVYFCKFFFVDPYAKPIEETRKELLERQDKVVYELLNVFGDYLTIGCSLCSSLFKDFKNLNLRSLLNFEDPFDRFSTISFY